MTDLTERLSTALADRYRIEHELGAGGMATVYLAEDLKHDRKVALKVLKPELAAVLGAERFVPEIKTTASLQHPHILPLYDSGRTGGQGDGRSDEFLFYVMPYIQGETLRDKLDRETQLGVEEAVRLAIEVADALQYAHEQGVIHRDIKPENILIQNGRALVADFGIALAVSAAAGGRMTETGLSLGTPHYMSPEQATADKDITARSDVYSLASVLYEMLAGEPPHMGNSAQQIIMKIIAEDAKPVTELRRAVPPNVAAAVGMGLEKLPADRFASAAAFRAALQNTAFATAVTAGTAAGTSVPMFRRSALTAALAATTIAALGLAAWGWLGRRARAPDAPIRVEMTLGGDLAIEMVDNHRLALSPDGRSIVFSGYDGRTTDLWLRDLGGALRRLPDTRDGYAPFFSPDGASIGFLVSDVRGADIRVVPMGEGGIVRTVVDDSASGYGATWADDGRIYFSHWRTQGLAAVPATGGTITQISVPVRDSGAVEYNYPVVLPGARTALAQLWHGSPGSNRIGAIDLETGAVTSLVAGTYAAFMPPDNMIVGMADGRLVAVKIDAETGALAGDPVPVVSDVDLEPGNGTSQFAVSRSGTLVYQSADTTGRTLVWVDRAGTVAPSDTTLTGRINHVALSPDDTRLALAIDEGSASSVWVRDLSTGTLTRLTIEGEDSDRPVWTPDGRYVTYLGTRDGRRNGWRRRADASSPEERAVPGSLTLNEVAYHPDGNVAVVRPLSVSPRTLYLADLASDSGPRPLFSVRADHFGANLSPDGRWLAYVSEESGMREVYVRPFPSVDSARYSISVGGATSPVWAHSGRELFFRGLRGEMMVAPVRTGPAFAHGEPRMLFSAPELLGEAYHRAYDVARDDRRFLMIQSSRARAGTLMLVVNWNVELARMIGGKP
jgi:Tol biopolymer transport system component